MGRYYRSGWGWDRGWGRRWRPGCLALLWLLWRYFFGWRRYRRYGGFGGWWW